LEFTNVFYMDLVSEIYEDDDDDDDDLPAHRIFSQYLKLRHNYKRACPFTK